MKTECSKGSAENDVTSVVIDRYKDLQGPEKKCVFFWSLELDFLWLMAYK